MIYTILVVAIYLLCGGLLFGAVYQAALCCDDIIKQKRETKAAQPHEAEREM